jgi:hypothetical protein
MSPYVVRGSGLLQAPFLHIHPEPIDHPAAPVLHVHSHLDTTVTGPVIGAHTADENEIEVDWHILTQPLLNFAVDLPVAEIAIVAPPSSSGIATSIPRPRGHDPPDVAPKSPRAPPA